MNDAAAMDWQGTTVAVTGAGGFFGSHLVERLLAEGASVRGLVHYNSRGDIGMLERLAPEARPDVVYGDLRSAASVAELVQNVDVVFHLAALVSVPHSYEDPAGYTATNVEGTQNLLDACRGSRCRRIVNISTSEVYGTAQTEKIHESHPLVAQSPYAATKIAAEKLCESYARSYAVPVVVVRPFNLYGPRQSRRAVIPEIITQALHGDVVRIGNVDAYRDFNYVADTVDALLKVASTPGVDGAVFNIGSGRSVQIREVIDTVADILGRSLRVELDAARLRPSRSEVHRLCADSSALRAAVGPRASTPLEVGLRRVVDDVRAMSMNAPSF